jgi:hypothetical protein
MVADRFLFYFGLNHDLTLFPFGKLKMSRMALPEVLTGSGARPWVTSGWQTAREPVV